ncbi:lysozyme inhibitor LprI family protein [Sphingomonas xinjiangensis]|uniref:Uncharacterized protein YecT (DUF1311 family) n=1 Tax=Sphingomonas xinjiangensis TaxID=643568 RepID=A0A840YSH1_9SPHN|nr:lysozyme inhibitor LprI family protein [Sphingomonas xinjiangensis]MBB5712617.1 uncharacterized protein YecT (DUF1311 family) [Sphingomonas xinjiangensis]
MVRISSKMLLATAIVSPFIASVPARAQHMNAAEAPCRSAGSGAEFAGCLSIAAKDADIALNEASRRILSVLSPQARQEFEDAQRTWRNYRDLACAAERNLYDGGTGGNAAYPACLEAVTRHRIVDLKAAYWWKVEKFGG